MPKTVRIPLSKLIIERHIEDDDRFTKLYGQLILGKIKVGLTRLPLSRIKTGFYVRRSGKNVHVSELREEHVPILERAIRSGYRPPLELYWSPLAPNGGAYVCADDEAALAAYAKLNFELVPCRVLKPEKVNQLEASIWIEQSGEHVSLAHAIAPAIKDYASVVGVNLPSFPTLISLLCEQCRRAQAAIVAFHRDNGPGIHYHQMLHAFLRRHERLLDSIGQMVALSRVEHAEALARVSDFFENARDKGKISPLGPSFHDLIYPPLSLVVHQSYDHLQQEASAFDDAIPDDLPWHVNQLGRWLDVVTAAIVLRIRNEVGMAIVTTPALDDTH
jgi:hypothetical protein